jgi:hypothetical protein
MKRDQVDPAAAVQLEAHSSVQQVFLPLLDLVLSSLHVLIAQFGDVG